MPEKKIRTKEELRNFFGEPVLRTVERQLDKLDSHCRHFIELSPFLVLSTAGPGGADASPKGDPPGFVKVIDDETLLIPDRRGNRRVDSMMNIVDSPGVGIIFFVPGVEETLRVNGEAKITTDPALLAPLSMKGKCPEAGLLIRVREAYFHCGKSIIRSKLWDPETRIERSAFPTLGRIVADQVPGRNVEEEDATTERVNREHLY